MPAASRRASSLAAFALVLLAGNAAAAAEAAPGAGVLWPGWAAPFVGLLLSIALLPVLATPFWHAHYGKVAAFWAGIFLLPFAAAEGAVAALHLALEALLVEYVPFIVLLGALYTVAGGVRLTGTLRGTPAVNLALLAGGTLAASVTGTTGAAMLLVRPLIRANRRRRHNQHVFLFFIILVANIGGSLSPLGDPPLFLGFLAGVPFGWPARNLLAPMAFTSAILLLLFFVIDSYLHRRAPAGDPATLGELEKLGVQGKVNLPLLLAILVITMARDALPEMPGVALLGVHLSAQELIATALLVVVSALSLRLTRPAVRRANEFTWAAMVEVALLFAALFVTIAPVLALLRAGAAGPAAALVALLNPGGMPDPHAYFWTTGLLSAVLDNAPTYLIFFNLAGGDAAELVGRLNATLIGISAGAVFFGALTYLGNAPNFMVRSIAEQAGIRMPSFLAYSFWACLCLLPIFAAVGWLFL